MIHPLINKSATNHYNIDGTSAVEELEKELSIREMIGFCSGNIFKYKYRQDRKGQKEADLIKIKTYEDYKKELVNLIHRGIDSSISVHHGWIAANKEWTYE